MATMGITGMVEMGAVVVEISLVKMLIWEMLVNDDEPLNLILSEAVVSENNKEYIKPPYCNEVISQNEIKDALKDLAQNNTVILLDQHGKPLKDKNIDEVLNSNSEWEFWFRITQTGEDLLEKNYYSYYNN